MAFTAHIRWTACLFVMLASPIVSVAQGLAQHARVELIARQESVQPGSDLQLGVHFILEHGWHIYWINPGDSGQPPSFKWHWPPGFNAGEIQWPRPERMQPSRELVDYGYHTEVLLPLTIHTPSSVRSDTPIEISAEVKWLVCREVCIPEHARLRLLLPVAAIARKNQQWAQLFDKTRKLLPRPLPRDWKASATSAKDKFLLTIRTGKPITKAEFFPLDPGQIDSPAPQIFRSSNMAATMTLKKSDLLVKPITILRGVLVIRGGPAYRIEAPVRQPIQ
ncbi:MAG TPA: protein-disulfide reductase DsbD domain-containing protein [Candidatus Angelobacter sp.]